MPLIHRAPTPTPPTEPAPRPGYSFPPPPSLAHRPSLTRAPSYSHAATTADRPKLSLSRTLIPRQLPFARLVRPWLVAVLALFLFLVGLRLDTGRGALELYGIPLVVVRNPAPFANTAIFPPGFDIAPNPLALLEEDRDAAYAIYGLLSADDLASPPMPPPAPTPERKPTRPHTFPEHTYLPNGLLEVNPLGRHPIYDLMDRAEREWEEKKARQSKTLEEAVTEYRRRWGMWPPKGFDRWWAYVHKHGIQLPDEYDQIMRDLSPFHAYTPASARALQQAASKTGDTYTVGTNLTTGTIEVIDDEGVKENPLAVERVRAMLALLRGVGARYDERPSGRGMSASEEEDDEDEEDVDNVERWLVEATGEWEATFRAEDGPGDFWDWEMGEAMREKVLMGEYLSLDWHPEEPLDMGWASACPPSSPLRSSADLPVLPPLPLPSPSPKTFIHSHSLTMSPCLHPDLVHTVGYFAEKKPPVTKDKKLVLSLCKTVGNGDVLSVPIERWHDEDEDVSGPWEDKDERMVWRGATTGIWHTNRTSWLHSQRHRLISHVSPTPLLPNTTHPVLPPYPPTAPIGGAYNLSAAFLGPVLTDVGFVGKAIQCDSEVCDEMDGMWEWRGRMDMDTMRHYKYLLDIDGNGWSARFNQLINSNSVVLKVTVFPEWYMDRVQPWYHYIPIQYDLSDLYDVLTFFRGDPTRGGLGSHDALAKSIGERGGKWSREFWRWEDMVAYVWRLMLEYARVVGEGREEREFRIEGLE